MRTVHAVAWKEIQIYFGSPMAYIISMMFLVLTGVFFVKDLGEPFPIASLTNFFEGSTLILVLLAPALTMRLLAEEQKLGTIELLLTSPIRDWEVVIGKFIASLGILLGMVLLTVYYPFLLFVFADPDPGPIYSGYLGLVLYGSAALAIGLMTSTFTSNQIVAAVVAMGLLLLLYFAGFVSGVVGGTWSTIISEMGLGSCFLDTSRICNSHFDDFAKGVIDTEHIVYYLSIAATSLFLSIRALESRRWR
jgi:ABC-2 type transport system permease protein